MQGRSKEETAADANINERKYIFFSEQTFLLESTPDRSHIFCFTPQRPGRSAAQPAFFSMGIAGYFPWVKGAGSEAGHSFSCSLEVKNEWRDTYTLYCCKDKGPYLLCCRMTLIESYLCLIKRLLNRLLL